MIKDKDAKDLLRALEDFDIQNPGQYMVKQQMKKVFDNRFFNESYLIQIIGYLKENYLIDYKGMGNYLDYRIRITPKGRNFLHRRSRNKILFKREDKSFTKMLLKTILKVIILLFILILVSVFTYWFSYRYKEKILSPDQEINKTLQ